MPNNHREGCQGNPLQRTCTHIVLCARTAMQCSATAQCMHRMRILQGPCKKLATSAKKPSCAAHNTSPRCKPVQSYVFPGPHTPQVWPDAVLPYSSPSTSEPDLHPHSHPHAARSTSILRVADTTGMLCFVLAQQVGPSNASQRCPGHASAPALCWATLHSCG